MFTPWQLGPTIRTLNPLDPGQFRLELFAVLARLGKASRDDDGGFHAGLAALLNGPVRSGHDGHIRGTGVHRMAG